MKTVTKTAVRMQVANCVGLSEQTMWPVTVVGTEEIRLILWKMIDSMEESG